MQLILSSYYYYRLYIAIFWCSWWKIELVLNYISLYILVYYLNKMYITLQEKRSITNSGGVRKSTTSNSFLFNGFIRFWWASTIQNFQEIGGLGSHPRMDISFAALDVVVQVITKQVNQIDGIIANIFVCMPWKQH